MFRISGSDFVRSLVTIATVTLSISLAGCSSSNNTAAEDAGPKVCAQADVDAIFTRSCIVCHDANGSYAGLNLTSTGLAARLLNVAPPGGGVSQPSVCSGTGQIYLKPGTNPAQGLLIDKLGNDASCGVRMPYMLPALATTDIDCIKSWALTLTSP